MLRSFIPARADNPAHAHPEGRANGVSCEYKKVPTYKWDQNGRYTVPGVFADELIPVEDMSVETIKTGMYRDLMFAAMLGTPEMAVYKIAQQRSIDENIKLTHFITLKGYDSNINAGHIGGGYVILRQTYTEAKKSLEHRADQNGWDEERLEHQAVLLASSWLTESLKYNDPNRSIHSPYVSSIEEALAWARLGDDVKRQLKGMRWKIRGVDLHGISRFIGKSGDDRYHRDSQYLTRQLANLNNGGTEGEWPQIFEQYQKHDLTLAEQDFALGQERLQNKYAKYRLAVESNELPPEERELQLNNLEERYQAELASLQEVRDARIQHLHERSLDDLREELRLRQEKLDHRREAHLSLAQKAIELHFAFNDHELEAEPFYGVFDFINDAPFGLINWAHAALARGLKPAAIYKYLFIRFAFPDSSVDRELMTAVDENTLNRNSLYNIKAITERLEQRSIPFTPVEVLKVADYDPNILEQRLNSEYTLTALGAFPWLKNLQIPDERFPFDRSKGAQENWCLRHAISIPQGWQRKSLGGLILNRLNENIDGTVHDATFWLSDFELPDSTHEITYRDVETEHLLLNAVIVAPASDRFRLPTNSKKYQSLFSSPARLDLYEALLAKSSDGPIDTETLLETFQSLVEQNAFQRMKDSKERIDPSQYSDDLQAAIKFLTPLVTAEVNWGNIPGLIASLRATAETRHSAIDEAFSWFSAHATTPRTLLTFAWKNRGAALKEGCEDNPKAIEQWASVNGLRAAFDAMEQNNRLPHNITRDDLRSKSAWIAEMIRHYDGETVIQELGRLKEAFNPDFIITPLKIDLGDGWVGEIIPKDDARGMTIGPDTGCCMTLNGASSSCIDAGYAKPAYGFFALYRNKQIVAQSFIYTNQSRNKSVMVCDNIEANQGRDMQKVTGKYQEFFNRYLQAQLRRNFGTHLTKVHVGTGYTDVTLNCPPANAVSMADPSIYTDASNQRLLYELPAEVARKAEQFSVSMFDRGQGWTAVKDDILEIEEAAFSGKGYSEQELEMEFTDAHSIVILLRDKGRIIGYSTALPTPSGKNDTLHVSSTAILPDYQHQGLVADIMYRLEVEAQKQGYKILTRDAMVQNGYAAAIERNYEVVERGPDTETPYGTQRYLAVKIPPRPQSTLLDTTEAANNNKEIYISYLDPAETATIIAMEQQCYPADMIQGQEFLENIFDEEEAIGQQLERPGIHFSLIARENELPVGYALVLPENSEVNEGELALHIQDMAVIPAFRGRNVAKRLLSHIINMAKDLFNENIQHPEMHINFRGAIELEARASSSYRLLQHPRIQAWLKKEGYEVVESHKLPAYLGGEDYYYMRLNKIGSQVQW